MGEDGAYVSRLASSRSDAAATRAGDADVMYADVEEP